MRIESNAGDQYDRLPTFLQWIKSAPSEELKPVRYVKKLWLPNQFPNLSLDTEIYRLRLSATSPVGTYLIENCEMLEESNSALFIEVVDRKKSSFAIFVSETETASWSALGPHGYELTICEKRKGNVPKKTRPDAG